MKLFEIVLKRSDPVLAIKVYGSNVCPGTMCFVSILTAHGIMPQFINVTGSIDHLKEFITFRDTSPI